MTTTIAWLALTNAMFTAFAASFYMGLMLVVQFFLKPAWQSLTINTLDNFFGVPIAAATKYFRAMFVPYLLSSGLLIWIGWGHTAAVVCAGVAVASYAFLALWFLWKMLPVNTKLLSGDVSDSELAPLISQWTSLNRARVAATVIYWLAALGFLLSATHVWEELP